MKKYLSTCMVFFSLLILPVSAVAAGIFIQFDDLSAPSLFTATAPLTNQYALSGVTFEGGGAILNEFSNFGVDPKSGSNFLAFNRNAIMSNGGIPMDPETIVFTQTWKTVSIWAAGGDSTDTFLMEAFGTGGNLVDTASITTQGWSILTVSSGTENIKKVVLTQTAGDGKFVFDDLRATDSSAPVPEPTSLTLLLAGIAGLAGLRSRRRS
jgi:hypothetical protein